MILSEKTKQDDCQTETYSHVAHQTSYGFILSGYRKNYSAAETMHLFNMLFQKIKGLLETDPDLKNTIRLIERNFSWIV